MLKLILIISLLQTAYVNGQEEVRESPSKKVEMIKSQITIKKITERLCENYELEEDKLIAFYDCLGSRNKAVSNHLV